MRQFAFGTLRATHYGQLCYTSVEAAKPDITYVTSGNLERDLPICSNKFIAPLCPLLMTPTLLLTLHKYRIQKGRHQDCYYGPHSTSSKPPKKLP